MLGGNTWIQTSAPSGAWKSIASDSNGMYLASFQTGNALTTINSYIISLKRKCMNFFGYLSIPGIVAINAFSLHYR